jgi:hypothetical protein
MTAFRGSLKGDAAIWRWVVEQLAEDRSRIAFWAAAVRGTSMVTRWQSVELRERAMLAGMRAKQLARTSARLRAESVELRDALASSNGSSLSTTRLVSRPQVVATR